MDNKNKKGEVDKTPPKFKVTEPFIFEGKTYLKGEDEKVPQAAREAFTAMLGRTEKK